MKVMKSEDRTEQNSDSDGGAVDSVQAAADYGIDVAQLRDNLGLSVGERLRRHQIALNTVEKLRKAKRR